MMIKSFPILAIFYIAVCILLLNIDKTYSLTTDNSTDSVDNFTNTNNTGDPIYITLRTDRLNYSLNQEVRINGQLFGDPSSIDNKPIRIEIKEDETSYYKDYVLTDDEGVFNYVFYLPIPGKIKIIASLDNRTMIGNEAEYTVFISPERNDENNQWNGYNNVERLIPIIPIVTLVANIAILLLSYPKHEKLGLVAALASSAVGLYFLNVSDIALIFKGIGDGLYASLLIPYIFQIVQDKRTEGKNLEKAVGTYRDDKLKQEVESLVNIFEEISYHQSILKSVGDIGKKLPKDRYDASIKAGTMANMPALRINQYYYYIDYYNKLLEYKLGRLGELSDDKKYREFNILFKDIKNALSKLNEILYSNLLYSIGEIQHAYFSFPTVKFPFRASGPLLNRLQKATVLKDGKISTDIFSQNNAYKLMSVIGQEFNEEYDKLDNFIDKVISYVPPTINKEGEGNGQQSTIGTEGEGNGQQSTIGTEGEGNGQQSQIK